jgi:hypothetical protein
VSASYSVLESEKIDVVWSLTQIVTGKMFKITADISRRAAREFDKTIAFGGVQRPLGRPTLALVYSITIMIVSLLSVSLYRP